MQRALTWAIRPCAAGLHSAVLASQAWPRSSRAPGWSALGARCLSPSDLRCKKGACPRPAAPGWSNAMNPPRVALFNLAHPKSDSWCARTPADPTSLPARSTRARTHTRSLRPVTTVAAVPTPALAFSLGGGSVNDRWEGDVFVQQRAGCEDGAVGVPPEINQPFLCVLKHG